MALAGVSDGGYVPHVVLGAYVLVLIGIGVVGFMRGKSTEEDYYLAGRRQGMIVTALTLMATFFSSAALLGVPGIIYKDGLAFVVFALNLPVSGGAVYVLGSKISRLGRAKGYVTPAEMVSDYYGSAVALRVLVALAGFLYVVPYVVMQISAGGHLAQRMFPDMQPVKGGWDMFVIGSTVMSVIMMLYIIVGGMRSVAWADVVQGTLLLVGMLLAGVATIAALGGVGGYFEEVNKLPTAELSMPGLTGGWSPWKMLTICVFASLASMVQPGQWMRYYAARSANTLRRSAVLFAGLLAVCYLFGIMFLGLGGKVLYPLSEKGKYRFEPTDADHAAGRVLGSEKTGQYVLKDPKNETVDWRRLKPHPDVGPTTKDFDKIVIVTIQEHMPRMLPGLGVVVVSIILVAILAASTSTADSNLHALSAVLTRDVYDRFIHPGAGDRERAWVGRGVIVAATLLALWLVHLGESNTEFKPLELIVRMSFVAMGFSCQIVPLTIDMLFLRRGTRAGAIAGMIAGFAVVFWFTPFPRMMFGTGPGMRGVYGLVADMRRLFDIGFCGFCVNAAVFVVVSLFTRRPDAKRVEELARIMDGRPAVTEADEA